MLVSPRLSAQSLAGLAAISGTVRDPSGAPVGEAVVTVANRNIGLERKIITNNEGYFIASSLPPGPDYQVSVKKPGFAVYETKIEVLQVGQNITMTALLTIAQQAEAVTVTAETPLVEQAKSGIAQEVENTQILNLPINGRRVDQFALLTPGATTDGTSGGVSFRGVPGGNAFLQDGNDVTQQWGLDIAGGSVVPSSISQDAVLEFQVQTSGYSAEFGRAVGGVINTVTKSGTNQYHGSGFWFFRNRSLNATDPYARYNPPEHRHQSGGSIGGPIIKDKLFFFANGEFTRRQFPLVDSIVNPQFYSGTTYIGQCGAPATPAQCAAAQAYFQRFFQTVPRSLSQNLGLGKLDWRPTDKHSVTASFNLLNFTSPNGAINSVAATDGSGVGTNGIQSAKTRTARLSETWIVSNSMVNEARFGWFKDRRGQDLSPELAPPNGLRSGLTVAGQRNLGVSTNIPNIQPSEDRYQFADNLSWTKGTHQIKFGVDFAFLRDTENALFNGPGSYTYGSITAFAQDLSGATTGKNWLSYTQSFGPLLTHASVDNYAVFAQDQWSVTRHFTVNYGLRYEYSTYTQPPLNPDYPATATLNQPGKNFAPRIGVAYSFNKDRTVFRAGYGIFYARLPSASVIRLQQRNGVIQKTGTLSGVDPAQLAAGPTFPNRLASLAGSVGLTNVTFASSGLATPYTEQLDASVEQAIGKNAALTVSYMHSRGYQFLSREDLNLGLATGSATYTIQDVNGNPTGTYTTPTYLRANRIDNRYASIIYLSNRGRLWYDGMTVSYRQRATKWISGTLAYTWSHALDEAQGAAADNIYFTDPPATTYNGDYQAEKGTSHLDQRQRLVVSAIIAPPRKDFGSGIVNSALNGWQLSLIETAASAQPVDPILIVSSGLPGLAGGTTINGMVTPFGAPGRVPFLPRSSVPIDTVNRMDGRLTKGFAYREALRLDLSFEVFNVFNTISNTSVVQNAYFATGTIIRAATGVGNGSASGGFPDGTNARRAQVSARFTF
ncbi:MAG: TonB-dependent receptor plug [Bryobacterales bacterium]|nr:TonB-dependent receptor plug [Bryobacterales bacterium]